MRARDWVRAALILGIGHGPGSGLCTGRARARAYIRDRAWACSQEYRLGGIWRGVAGLRATPLPLRDWIG